MYLVRATPKSPAPATGRTAGLWLPKKRHCGSAHLGRALADGLPAGTEESPVHIRQQSCDSRPALLRVVEQPEPFKRPRPGLTKTPTEPMAMATVSALPV